MLKEHCFHRQYVIVPYGTIFEGADTKGLKRVLEDRRYQKKKMTCCFPRCTLDYFSKTR